MWILIISCYFWQFWYFLQFSDSNLRQFTHLSWVNICRLKTLLCFFLIVFFCMSVDCRHYGVAMVLSISALVESFLCCGSISTPSPMCTKSANHEFSSRLVPVQPAGWAQGEGFIGLLGPQLREKYRPILTLSHRFSQNISLPNWGCWKKGWSFLYCLFYTEHFMVIK